MKRFAAILLASLIGLAAGVRAADLPPPSGVLSLGASASVEVARDLMSVVLTTTRDGPDAQVVQAGLKQALEAALAEARRAAKPGQIDVQTGNFSLYPRYGSKGQMMGWQGSAELMVEGRDMPGIAELVGRIGTMTVGRVAYRVSRELREKTESEASAQAIARYRAKAADAARAFGYSGYTLREVNVGTTEPPGGPVPVMRASVASTAEAAPLPVEAGKAVVTVNVNGTVQLTR